MAGLTSDSDLMFYLRLVPSHSHLNNLFAKELLLSREDDLLGGAGDVVQCDREVVAQSPSLMFDLKQLQPISPVSSVQ